MRHGPRNTWGQCWRGQVKPGALQQPTSHLCEQNHRGRHCYEANFSPTSFPMVGFKKARLLQPFGKNHDRVWQTICSDPKRYEPAAKRAWEKRARAAETGADRGTEHQDEGFPLTKLALQAVKRNITRCEFPARLFLICRFPLPCQILSF